VPTQIHVECYAGQRGDEEPRAFYLDHRRIDVMAVIERWRDPRYRCFKVQAYDGETYTLCHDEHSGHWEME